MDTAMTADKPDGCLLFTTHILDDFVISYAKHIKEEVSGLMDFVVLYDCARHQCDINGDLDVFQFNSDQLDGFFFRGDRRLPSGLAALLSFAEEREYGHYMLMEYDIAFTGDFRGFVENVVGTGCDYVHIGTDVVGTPQDHWPVQYIQDSPFGDLKFAWQHIFYISRGFLGDACRFIKEVNDSFHYEFLLPTMAYEGGRYKARTFESLGYSFDVSWGPAEEYEARYEQEHNADTFYHPVKNMRLVDLFLRKNATASHKPA